MGYEQDEVSLLELISAALIRTSIAPVQSLTIIRSASCPLLKFRTAEGNIPVDLSVSIPSINGMSNRMDCANGPAVLPYVADWLRTLPALRSLTMFLKLFLKLRGMDSVYTGGLGGYSLLVYVRSFLKVCCFSTPRSTSFEWTLEKPSLSINIRTRASPPHATNRDL